MFSQADENAGDLCGSLALTKDNFRHPRAEGAMMIDFGEAEIFEGHVPQLLDGGVGRKSAASNLLKQFADGFGVQDALSGWCSSRMQLE